MVMKKNITSIVVVALITFYLSACKKNDQLPQTTLQKIQNKWTLVNIVDNYRYFGSDHITTSLFASTDYWDFRTDGKIYMSTGSLNIYSLPSDTTKILISGWTYDIKTLTSNSFIIYLKEEGINGRIYDFFEETMTFKR